MSDDLPIDVRRMRPDEFDAIRDLSVAAFGGDAGIAALIEALRTSWAWDDHTSFIAQRGGTLVAQVLYTHALLDAPDRLVDVLVLSPVGVTPELRGLGIGTALITRSLQIIDEAGITPLVFLEGSPRYYPRFGFEPAATLGFRSPSERIPPAAFQVRRMAGWAEWMTGTLVYPDAFWRTDSVGLRMRD